MLLHVEHWILIVTSAYLAARFTARVHERRLLAARAAMRHARMRDARFTSVETGALEWINHVLRHEWRAVIGARVDAQAGATLASVLADAPAMTAGVVRDAEVDACTLGVVPPDLNLYVSRFDPIAEYLQFEFDLDWRTVSSHIVIGATIKPTAFDSPGMAHHDVLLVVATDVGVSLSLPFSRSWKSRDPRSWRGPGPVPSHGPGFELQILLKTIPVERDWGTCTCSCSCSC